MPEKLSLAREGKQPLLWGEIKDFVRVKQRARLDDANSSFSYIMVQYLYIVVSLGPKVQQKD